MLIELVPPAARTHVILECEGSGAAEGYPFGRQATGRGSYRVELSETALSVFDLSHREPLAFCTPDAECSVSRSAAGSELTVRHIPGRDPLYTQSFRLDRESNTYQASGGGLDGGWTQTGTCEVASE